VASLARTLPADPVLFGPQAPKVKGGTDLVGDAYNASSSDPSVNTPVPDLNPLDCNGHGSHVAGTAAGFGVSTNGTMYSGAYDQVTYTNNSFSIGPGVAPKADLYAVRVFGCEGSTDVVAEAIDWAVDNDMDVVNMSLGADFQTADSADALAADNAMKAGVVVVSAAGNAGDIRYILGSPASSTKGIAVAASAKEGFDTTVNFALPAIPAGPAAKTIAALNANGAAFSPGSLEVKVLRNANGAVSLGCNPAEYVSAGVTGKLVVTQRGTCARVARATFGQQAGAAAVVMINNATSLPPFEGPITSNPDTGEPFTVSIPFYGVRGLAGSASSDGFALVQRDGLSIALTEGIPIQTGLATFSSGGPRTPDSLLKPDITAPGVNILDARRLRQPVAHDFRHVDGHAACRRDRGADDPGASHVEARRDQIGDHQQRQPERSRRLRDTPRRLRFRERGCGRRHAGVCVRRQGRDDRQLRFRGFRERLLEDADDQGEERRARRQLRNPRTPAGIAAHGDAQSDGGHDSEARHGDDRDDAARSRGHRGRLAREPSGQLRRVPRRRGPRHADADLGGVQPRHRLARAVLPRDVDVDSNNDGTPDFVVFSVDLGLITTGAFNGQQVAGIFNLATGELVADFFAVAATNSNTILLPVLGVDVGVTAANPRFSYTAFGFDLLSDDQDAFAEAASFNAFASAISTGQFVMVNPDELVSVSVEANQAEAAITPAKGLMIVTPDNRNGPREADLIPVAAVRPS
jgi:hypothetical protein